MNWTTGYEEYVASREVRLHRKHHTFAGYVWPRRITVVLDPEVQLSIAMAALAKIESDAS